MSAFFGIPGLQDAIRASIAAGGTKDMSTPSPAAAPTTQPYSFSPSTPTTQAQRNATPNPTNTYVQGNQGLEGASVQDFQNSMTSGGPWNAISSSPSGYNPAQYADPRQAQALANVLGGSVINTRNIPSAAGDVPSQPNIDFGGGFASNAGLLAQNYAKYGPEVANRMLQDEMKSSGGGFNPAYQNANPTMFNEQTNTSATPSFTPMARAAMGGGPAPSQARVDVAQPAGRTPGTANPIVGGTPNRPGSDMGFGGFNGAMRDPFSEFGGTGGGVFGGGFGGSQQFGNDPVSQMMSYLQGLRGMTGGPSQMNLMGFRQPTNGFSQMGSPLYNRARTALGYTRWQPQPRFRQFQNGSWGQGVNNVMGGGGGPAPVMGFNPAELQLENQIQGMVARGQMPRGMGFYGLSDNPYGAV